MNHPSSTLLMEYAAGTLHAGAALVLACHATGCVTCRNRIALFTGIGGALLNASTPVALSEGALERALTALDEPVAFAAAPLPAYLERYAVPNVLKQQRFGRRRFVTPNIWFAPIRVDERSDARTYLVYGTQHTTLAEHSHHGREVTAVLSGAFRDDNGVYAAGDFAENGESDSHAPVSVSPGGCLCIISSDGPMRLVSQLARFVQNLTGTLY